MILKGSRVKSQQVSHFLLNHLLHGDENDVVAVLQGGREEIERCIADAEARGCTYAVRHLVISPARPMTDEEAFVVLGLLAMEFGFAAHRATLVRHEKPRHGIAETVPHFHIAVPEFDPTNSDKVLRTRFDFRAHEKVARIAEVRFGHPITPGPHHLAVIRELDADGLTDIADAIRSYQPPRGPGSIPTAYTAATAAQVKRAGLDPAEIVEEVRKAFEICAAASEFVEMIGRHGLSIRPGERRTTTPCIYHGDRHVEALHRLLGRQIGEVRAFLAQLPAPGTAMVPRPDRPIDIRPAMPPAAQISDHEIVAEFKAQLLLIAPEPVDETRRSELADSVSRIRRMNGKQRRVGLDAAGRKTEIEAEIAATPWLRRVLLDRKAHAVRLAEAARLAAIVEDQEAFVRDWEERLAPISSAYQRENRKVEALKASAAERHEVARRRLIALATIVRDDGLRFETIGELRAFIRDVDPIGYREQRSARFMPRQPPGRFLR